MPPKKKLSKKEKARLEAEAAESARLEMERERLRKIEEEKDRQVREKKEAEKRQYQEVIEHKQRKQQLKDSIEYLLKLKQHCKEIRRQEKTEREWTQFMRCTGQPNTSDPCDLRQYIFMWKQAMEKREKQEMNWLLHTNAQSVLTQDQTIPNMSYEFLRSKQPISGDYYAQRLTEILGILKELDITITEEELSDRIMQELHELQATLRLMVSDFLNDFSYKILLNVKRDMDLEGLNVAQHKYNSVHFKNQIYTTIDMPQPIILNPKEKAAHDGKHIEINFVDIGVEVVLPPIIKCHYSAIRALWVDFDHYSDYCKTIDLPYIVDFSKNIRQTTKGEWKKRKEVLKMVLEEILSDKPAPEENPDDPEASVAPRDLDVDKIFTDYEDEIRREERRKKGPESLKLKETEVNLRSHRITGGVYHFDYVEQPQQHVKLGPKAYLRTLPQPAKLVMKDWHQFYVPPPVPEPGVRRLPEEIEAELKMVEENFDKLCLVTLQLPETIFWFEPPIVCRWEPITTDEHLLKRQETRFRRKKQPPVKVVEDFNLLEVPCNNQLQTLIAQFVIPKIPDGYGVKINRLDPELLKNANGTSPVLQDVEISPQLSNLIYETRSPSFLHPGCGTKRILQVVSSKGYSEYSESFNNEGSDTSELKEQEPVKEEVQDNVYMFSKFMQDLDELIESKRPIFQRKIEFEEIEPEAEPEEEEEEKPPELSEAELALLKLGGDLDFNAAFLMGGGAGSHLFQKKEEEKEPDPESEEDSEDDYDELVEDQPRKVFRSKKIRGRWITDDIHDIKYNEDKLQMQFRIGKLGVYAMASPRYSNIPFQGWDIKPDLKNPGTLIFAITASIMTAEFSLSPEGVKLNAIQGGATNALQDHMNTWFSIRQMIKVMRDVSADIFPDDDAFYYVDGSCEKNSSMEYHLYNCMGTMIATHNFAWSRWNTHVGSRTCVILMREIIEHRKIPHFSTVHVTPLKACVVDCTEVGAAFSSIPVAGMEYYADLHQLNQAITQPALLEKQEKVDPRLRDNFILWFKSIRPLSFS